MNDINNIGWDRLRHGGLLLDPRHIACLADSIPASLSSQLEWEMRRKTSEILDGKPNNADIQEYVAFVIQIICGFSNETGSWLRGSQISQEWTRRAVTGEAIRPRQIWCGCEAGFMPVFIESDPHIGLGRGRKTVSQVYQWLRAGKDHLAILTNGKQWRLIFVGLDYDAWCEWDIDLWFEQGRLSPQVTALRTLISPSLWTPPSKDAVVPLLQSILDSRKGQAELSAILGERVRDAVEKLIQGHGNIIKEKCAAVESADIYRAAVRVIMRLVVALFAESRDLLPRDVPLYYESYGLAGLIEELEKSAARGGNKLAQSYGAWPRVLALFRLIYSGSHHEELPVPAYGGELFAPGDCAAADGLSRVLAVFETACFEPDREAISDLKVYELLNMLTRTRIKVRQGKARTWVTTAVDFSDLSSEYIGILYEGLLDYELKTAGDGEPVVFLAIGQEPALPLSRLEKMDEKALASLLENMKKTREDGEEESTEESGETSNEPSEREKDEPEEEGPEVEELGAESHADISEIPYSELGDERRTVRTRAEVWARQAVVAGKLIQKIRGTITPEKQLAYEKAIGHKASQLVSRVVLPGEHFLVRWGGTRKGAGTFYTRPGLAIPTVYRTLRPLAYNAPLDADGKPNYDAPSSAWTPKKPEEILALKVCDPACGSGTFPVAALRFLTEAVYDALHAHGRLTGDVGRPMDEILGLAPAGGIPESMRAFRLSCRPEDEQFENKTKAVLRRYVVERSIYGVDIDPLAVELCRLSLWIETMDRTLPFSFLDHKIKCGNSLVGAWFDQFRHYPVMAWKNREGGDKGHTNGVHFAKETQSKEIKNFVKIRLVPDLVHFLSKYALFPEGFLEEAELAHKDALAVLARLHEYPIHETAERARVYHETFLDSEYYRSLKIAMDIWCACWFWPVDQLDIAPLPTTLSSPAPETIAVAESIASKKHFFHWELEFPDVFRTSGCGFDAMFGNPPWDIAKTNSKEFFSNTDPLYRSYGKQEGLRFQTKYFQDTKMEKAWLDYNADFKAQSNFMSFSANPYGDPKFAENGQDRFTIVRGGDNDTFHEQWREARSKSRGYSDAAHPFRHQGSADLNLYKLFLEQAHSLLRDGGRLGFIVPSGLYSDHGTGALRKLFLDNCRWEWLFGFENREGIFDIHRSFKFNPVIIEKGGSTTAIRTAFMRRKLEDWECGEEFVIPYSRDQVERFSPHSFAILEIQSRRDLEILEKIYSNSVLLGDQGPDGWGIKYSTEFHMTNDSKLFPPRPWWEERGYRPDEYSRWLKGTWRPIGELWAELGINPTKIQPLDVELEDWLFDATATPEERQAKARYMHGHLLKPGDVERTNWRLRCAQPPYDSLPIPRADIPAGLILSRNADEWIREDKIEDIAIPLFQGAMIANMDLFSARYTSENGGGSKWNRRANEEGNIQPKYLISLNDCLFSNKLIMNPKIAYRRIARTTDTRTVIAAMMPGWPAGDSVFFYVPQNNRMLYSLILAECLSSFVYDYQIRRRLAGTNLSDFVMAETAVPSPSVMSCYQKKLLDNSLSSCLPSVSTANLWLGVENAIESQSWRNSWAISEKEHMRLEIISNSIIALCFGMNEEYFKVVMDECDIPSDMIKEKMNKISPIGFWRVNKEKKPQNRKTVLSIIAFHDLTQQIKKSQNDIVSAIKLFIEQNNGDGWLIPENIRLADYGLGHDESAKHSQPVASRLGFRFYDWQLTQSSEESWQECHIHARNMLGDREYQTLIEKNNKKEEDIAYSSSPRVDNGKPKDIVAEKLGPLFSADSNKREK